MFRFRKSVYCDNNATTPVSKQVQKVMARVLRECYANPSSPYKMAHKAAGILAEARKSVAGAINAPPETIVFTSCATESNNTLASIALLLPKNKRRILYNPTEHPAMLETLFHLQGGGFSFTPFAPDRQGRIDPEQVNALWQDDIGLVVCMYANNETGTLYDVGAMAAMAHEKGALFFSDMVQALGKIPVDVQATGVDYASFSAHKIYGPKGIGALYVREGAPFAPFMLGGHQEEGLRAGTESLHNIAGFAAATEEIPQLLAGSERLGKQRDNFVAAMRQCVPDCVVNSPEGPQCQPGTVSMTFPGRANAVLMGQLDYYGVSVAAGSACNTGEDKPSHVLTAIGLSAEEARSTLRISFPSTLSGSQLRYVTSIFTDVLTGKGEILTALQPSQLTEAVLFAPDVFIIDLRRTAKTSYALCPLPNSIRFPFFSIAKHVHKIPRGKHILVTCEVGYDAPIIAYYLKRNGFKHITFLMWGILGWKLAQPELYGRYAQKHGAEDSATKGSL